MAFCIIDQAAISIDDVVCIIPVRTAKETDKVPAGTIVSYMICLRGQQPINVKTVVGEKLMESLDDASAPESIADPTCRPD